MPGIGSRTSRFFIYVYGYNLHLFLDKFLPTYLLVVVYFKFTHFEKNVETSHISHIRVQTMTMYFFEKFCKEIKM